MKLRLNSLIEGSQIIEMTLTKSDLAISGDSFIHPILASLNIYKSAHQTTVKGRMKTDVTLQCDRCLEFYDYDLDVTFQSVLSLMKSMDSKTDESIIQITSKTNEVDLSPFAHDALIIGLPMKKICSETCKGICSGCGINLNQGTCKCESTEVDDRWKPLENLLTNTPEE